jgi:hypothetical protein
MADRENRKTLRIMIECAKMTPEIFEKAINEMINNISNHKSNGKTTLNSLLKDGKVDNIEVNDNNIGSFAKTARKYNLTYALKRTKAEDGRKCYLVCFQGKDLDTMQRAFKEYSCRQTHKKETLFSRKRIAAIDISEQDKNMEQSRDKQKEHKKERSSHELER